MKRKRAGIFSRNRWRIARVLARAAIRRYKKTYTTKTRYLRGTKPRAKRRRIQQMTSRTTLGRTPGTSTAKRRMFFQDMTSYNSRTRHVENLLDIAFTTGPPALNEREGNLVNFRGVQIDLTFQVNSQYGTTPSATQFPLAVNVAVVIPKNDSVSSNIEWFKNMNPITKQNKDFDPLAPWKLMHTDPINTQEYQVLKHERFELLPPQSDGASTVVGSKLFQWLPNKSSKDISMYIPVNRQVNYPDTSSALPEKNMQLVWWYASKDSNLSPEAQLSRSIKVTQYFREPRK